MFCSWFPLFHSCPRRRFRCSAGIPLWFSFAIYDVPNAVLFKHFLDFSSARMPFGEQLDVIRKDISDEAFLLRLYKLTSPSVVSVPRPHSGTQCNKGDNGDSNDYSLFHIGHPLSETTLPQFSGDSYQKKQKKVIFNLFVRLGMFLKRSMWYNYKKIMLRLMYWGEWRGVSYNKLWKLLIDKKWKRKSYRLPQASVPALLQSLGMMSL